MAHGAAVWSTVRHDAGAGSARRAGRFGRFGWINLIGLLAAHPGRGGRDDLVALVDGTPADELRFVVAGGRREQMRERLGALLFQYSGDPRAIPAFPPRRTQ